jgi:hypothetical protein
MIHLPLKEKLHYIVITQKPSKNHYIIDVFLPIHTWAAEGAKIIWG